MATIKRGTTPTIRVALDGIVPDETSTIEFIFKPSPFENARTLLEKKYPDNVEYDPRYRLYLLTLTDEETRRLPQRHKVYMDTRITLRNGAIPTTEIAEFMISETLFSGGDGA